MQELTNQISNDRIFVLETLPGKTAINSTGSYQADIFRDNRLHGIMEPATCLWYCSLDNGVVPGALKQKFTSFSRLRTHVENFLKTRNLRVKEVID